MNQALKWSIELKKLIAIEIKKILEQQMQKSSKYNTTVMYVYENIFQFISKRVSLGPILSLAVYIGLTGISPKNDIIKIAAALEFYTYSILIHDDLIDNDTKRWDGKSFHILSENRASFDSNHSDSKRVGQSIAILAGNLLSLLAFETISSTNISLEKKMKMVNILSEEFRKINESQISDLQFETQYPDSKTWYKMASQRAASHVSVCIRIGAVLGECNLDDETTLKKASQHLGYFFDIRDDLRDAFSNKLPNDYSKRDIRMGKKPLYVCYAIENSTKNDRKKIIKLFTESNNNEELLSLLQKYGLEKANSDLRFHAKKALELLQSSSINDNCKKFFQQLLSKDIEKPV